MNDKCNGCKYVIADVYAPAKNPYKCVNQDSPCFGQEVGAGCDEYERFEPKPDMEFKDALEMLIMTPKGACPSWFFRFGRTGEPGRPFYSISFESNKQMYQFREAMMRCFEELMELKKDAGDFTEEAQHGSD